MKISIGQQECVGAYRVRDYTLRLTRIDTPLLDNKQQELTSLMLETPLPKGVAVIGYTGQYNTVGKLIVQQSQQQN